MKKEQLLSLIREQHPSSIGALRISLERVKLEIRDEELVALIQQLSSEGLISLRESAQPSSFADYLISVTHSWWVYTFLVLALAETFLVEYEPGSGFLIICRLLLGFALLGFIPGYSTLEVILPSSKLPLLERMILSIFLSILISILSGVLLGSVLAFQATANVLVLAGLTFVMTFFAGYRSFDVSKSKRG